MHTYFTSKYKLVCEACGLTILEEETTLNCTICGGPLVVNNAQTKSHFHQSLESEDNLLLKQQHDYQWDCSKLSPESKDAVLSHHEQLQSITQDGFGTKDVSFSKDKLEVALSTSTHVALLKHQLTGIIGGFAFYFISDEPLLVGKYAYINKVCVSKIIQGRGYSYELAKEILSDRGIAWLGARTQNPQLIKVLTKYASLTYPLDVTYDKVDGKAILSFIRNFIPQVNQSSNSQMDSVTGICKNYYGNRLGDFPITPTVNFIEQRLAEMSFSRVQGDAVLISAFINHKSISGNVQR
ncbi:MAG: hypothetical protein R3A50_16555 [Saprospiraceae bacterium]